jgi:membrane protease YdiL (CAAX protease family)
MSQVALRRINLLEPLAVFVLIMVYIWGLRFRYHEMWLFILAIVMLSHAIRRERPESLGFHTHNLRQCLDEFLPALVFMTLAMIGTGMLLEPGRHIRFSDAFLAWMWYLPWGTFQQYLLNGYFLNRLARVMAPRNAGIAAAMLFSGAHLPNWFLMAVTLLAGYCCSIVYMRHKNLFFLGIAHATIGVLLLVLVPDSISHHLIVGPGWFGR